MWNQTNQEKKIKIVMSHFFNFLLSFHLNCFLTTEFKGKVHIHFVLSSFHQYKKNDFNFENNHQFKS